MTCIIQRGLGISQGVLMVSRRTLSPTQILTAQCPVKLKLGPCQGRPVRMISISTSKRIIGPMGFFLLSIPVATFCLGTWQVRRRSWKLNLISELESKTTTPSVEFPQELSELEDLEYRKVKITGSFDHSKEVFIGPRPLMISGDVQQSGSGLISSGQSGYLVITPFKLAERDLTILINRGWIPRKSRNPRTRLEGQIEGPVELTAVVRRTENRAPFMPDNTKGSPIFIFRDVPSISKMLGTAPVFLDAVESFPGGPRGGQTRVTMRNEHLSYIFTWYSLCAATSYLWYRRFIRGMPLM